MSEERTQRKKARDVGIALALYPNVPKVFSNKTAHQVGEAKSLGGCGSYLF